MDQLYGQDRLSTQYWLYGLDKLYTQDQLWIGPTIWEDQLFGQDQLFGHGRLWTGPTVDWAGYMGGPAIWAGPTIWVDQLFGQDRLYRQDRLYGEIVMDEQCEWGKSDMCYISSSQLQYIHLLTFPLHCHTLLTFLLHRIPRLHNTRSCTSCGNSYL